MGFIITWILIVSFFVFIFSLFRPQLINLLLPLQLKFKRVHNLIVFICVFIAGVAGLNFAMKSQARASKIEPKNVAGDYTYLVEEGDHEDSEVMDPDPDAQAGVYVPKVERKVEEPKVAKSTSHKGCTDPTASNYDPEATVNDGSCINTASDPNPPTG